MSDNPVTRLQARFIREDHDRKRAILKHLLQEPEGRNFLWALMADCGIFNNPHSATAAETSFRCGEMNSGQRLLTEIMETDHNAFGQMMREKEDERRSRKQRLDDAARSTAGRPNPDFE